MAKMIIEQNEQFLGKEITDKAKEVVDRQDSNEKEGGNEYEEKAKATRRTRKTI